MLSSWRLSSVYYQYSFPTSKSICCAIHCTGICDLRKIIALRLSFELKVDVLTTVDLRPPKLFYTQKILKTIGSLAEHTNDDVIVLRFCFLQYWTKQIDSRSR